MLRISQTNIKIPHAHVGAKLFAHLSFILTTANAAFGAIFPLILEKKLGGPTYVGMYYALISFICIIASVVSTNLFIRFSKVLIARIVLFCLSLLIFGMNYAASVWHLGFLDVPRAVCIMISYIVLALFVRDFSTKNQLAESEGHYFFYSSLGWMVGPLVGGFVASQYGAAAIYNLVASIFFICWLYFEIHGVKERKIAKEGTFHTETLRVLFSNIVEYFKVPDLRKVFWISFGFNFWWAIRGIYIPLAIIAMGYGEQTVGIFMALGMLPCVFFEKLAVRLAEKSGVRNYIVAGFASLAAFILLFYICSDIHNLVLLFFVLANIGAAFIESLKVIYFFEVVKKKDAERFWGIYNVAEYAAYLVGPFIMSLFLSVIPSIPKMWGILSLCMAGFALLAMTIEKKVKK